MVDCVVLSTLALFVQTLHTYTCESEPGIPPVAGYLPRWKERKKEKELTNSTIHSHGAVILLGPGSRHEWV